MPVRKTCSPATGNSRREKRGTNKEGGSHPADWR